VILETPDAFERSTAARIMNGKCQVEKVLRRQRPDRIVYAPNYWQWSVHHRNHGLLPPELARASSQLEVIRHLGLDVFSRNLYCDATRCWFGGLAEEVWDGVEVQERRYDEGRDTVTERTYRTRAGVLTERLRFVFAESTLVQEKHLLDDFATQMDSFEALVLGRRWRFNRALWEQWSREIGDDGLLNIGELFSPLKLLHMAAGADQAVFMLEDYPERCRELMAVHQAAQLDLLRQILDAGAVSVIAMDNLDAAFHPPRYVERYSASFYEQASRLCHEHNAVFFIHACGRQKPLLPLIASLNVDGLEGVAYPPLGNVQLDEAMRLGGERLIITGGISAIETEGFTSYDQTRRYLDDLLGRLRPYSHRFMLAASCSTSIKTPWQTLLWFRDAWREA
jgi:hypothetical protein